MIKKPPKIARKCRICGKPTYHDICADCEAKANADERERRKPYRPASPYKKYYLYA